MDEMEALRRRVAELETSGAKPSAAAGFSGGFFGCFGWLAAAALVGFVVFAIQVVNLWNHGVRAEDIKPDGSIDRAAAAERTPSR